MRVLGLVLLFVALNIQPERGPNSSPETPTAGIDGTAPFFVPNLGQWDSPTRFVQKGGALRLLVENRGWTLVHEESNPLSDPSRGEPTPRGDVRGVAVRMRFVGRDTMPARPEERLVGVENYFLGSDPALWRTDVPRYGALRLHDVAPGIDVRLHQRGGRQVYDLHCEPGADLATAVIEVSGAERVRIDREGVLCIDTTLGCLRQPPPTTWERLPSGANRPIPCEFVMIDERRFSFHAPTWSGDYDLVIDPDLLWSTKLGGGADTINAVSVDGFGVATVCGFTVSNRFPTTVGAYNRTSNGMTDAFVSRLDPRGASTKLAYSTYVGGSGNDAATALVVLPGDRVAVTGYTLSTNFPTTSGAYDSSANGKEDAILFTLEPTKVGAAQLVHSTYLGGKERDTGWAIARFESSVVVAGLTRSTDHPTTTNSYDQTYNGGTLGFDCGDGFVSGFDPTKSGAAQLVYSTFYGGTSCDSLTDVHVDALGVITLAGYTESRDLPMTTGTFDPSYNGGFDGFLLRLDPRKTGSAQLTYATYLGGNGHEFVSGIFPRRANLITVAGETSATDFPTTPDAYDRTPNGREDGYVLRLDLSKTGSAQLAYSTLVGGSLSDRVRAATMAPNGVVTIGGQTLSLNYPTTLDAFSRSNRGGGDAFLSSIDPEKAGAAQLTYSTMIGGFSVETALALATDPSGVPTIAGQSVSPDYPLTTGALSGGSGFLSRLVAGVDLRADLHDISLSEGGVQRLFLDASKANAGRRYAIIGSSTGTTPGVVVDGLHISLNPDVYSDFTISRPGSPLFTRFTGTLDASGQATAEFNVSKQTTTIRPFTLHHAFVLFNSQGSCDYASNSVAVTIAK